MEYSAINGKIRLGPDAVIIERTGFGAKVAGLGGAGRRIALTEISDAKLKPATRLVNGYLTIGVRGRAVPELGAGTAASDLNTVIFKHAQAAQFGALHEWLIGVAEANKQAGLFPTVIEPGLPAHQRPGHLEDGASRPAADRIDAEPVGTADDRAADVGTLAPAVGDGAPKQRQSDSRPAAAERPSLGVGLDADSSEQAHADWATAQEIKMAQKLGTDRPDIVEAAARMGWRLGGNRELKKLTAHLHEGERVRLIAQGRYTGRQGILVMTDTRLLFLFHGFVSQAKEDFPLRLITSVQTTKSLAVGQLVVTVSGRTSAIDGVLSRDLDLLADALRIGMAQPVSPPTPRAIDEGTVQGAQPDPYEALRQLGALRDSGVLTQEEFEAKKKQLLDRL